jgi:hypothetical protein
MRATLCALGCRRSEMRHGDVKSSIRKPCAIASTVEAFP